MQHWRKLAIVSTALLTLTRRGSTKAATPPEGVALPMGGHPAWSSGDPGTSILLGHRLFTL